MCLAVAAGVGLGVQGGCSADSGHTGAPHTLPLPASTVVGGGQGVSRFLEVVVGVELAVAMIQGTFSYSIPPLPCKPDQTPSGARHHPWGAATPISLGGGIYLALSESRFGCNDDSGHFRGMLQPSPVRHTSPAGSDIPRTLPQPAASAGVKQDAEASQHDRKRRSAMHHHAGRIYHVLPPCSTAQAPSTHPGATAQPSPPRHSPGTAHTPPPHPESGHRR